MRHNLPQSRHESRKTQRELLDLYFESLKQRGFFGQVVLKLEAGKVVYINESRGWTRLEAIGRD
jgi:hypothetical protein